ncbi:MAG TPA: hypothetical protein VKA84_21230, partial [Gemmatimonadaceae bacterium]|nr:hypothetical protein [Gemmatimonadaceae bacterium]
MTSSRIQAARHVARGLGAALAAAVAVTALASVPASAQRRGNAPPPRAERRGFDLFGVVDYAATGVRAPTATYRFFVTNSGPMDIQSRQLEGAFPASVVRSSVNILQFPEVTLFAAAAPGDRAASVGRIPSLANAAGGGAAVSFNFHKASGLQLTRWYAADGLLGFAHSGARTATTGCVNHTPPLPVGIPLMPGSDCPQTWGLNGWQGRRPVPLSSYFTIFSAGRDAFRFNFFDVPLALQDTSAFLGDRFQTYGTTTDYSRSRVGDFGNVIPGGAGAPKQGAQGYPLGLEFQFDAFTVNDAPGVVFWQATITNKTDSIYGNGGINYDSLFVGVIARHGRRLRAHAGFDPSRGTAFFNEIGNDDATVTGLCDNADPVPGSFASDAFFGDCREPVGFTSGASAITFLKSPIGDLRYKLFSDPTSQFYHPTSPARGDTITYNIGRMCGDECVAERAAVSVNAAYGIVASREELALNGDGVNSLSPLAYWMLFHPANKAAVQTSLRWNSTNPRGGGGFNFTPLPGWRYGSRPASAPAAGSDTLWFDTCNPAIDPVAVPIVVPPTRAQTGRCTGRWVDTLPDKTLNFTRGATWLGTGPFRLPAGGRTGMILAISVGPDSLTLERNIDGAISLYQTFFVAPTPVPSPRITSVQVAGGTIRQTSVRLLFENRA